MGRILGQVAQRPTFIKGDRILWQQTTPSAGWTKETTAAYDDTCPRIVTGSVTNGGSSDFSAIFNATVNTENESAHTHTGPEHNHQVYARTSISSNDHDHVYNSGGSQVDVSSNTKGSGARHLNLATGPGTGPQSHYSSLEGTGNTGAGTAHNHELNLTLKFYDVCIGIKA